MALAVKGQTTKVVLNGGTPVQVAAAKSPNEDRKSMFVFNLDGTATVELAFAVGSAANFPTNGGIPIPPGGNLLFGYYDQQRLHNGDVWMRVTGGGTPAAVCSYTEN